jgi:hypothetical protein
MSKVFVIHQPAVRDRHTGEMRPQFDLSPALRFGEVVDVLPPGSVTQDYGLLRGDIRRRLLAEGFDASKDHILALGDPVAMALGVLVAAQLVSEAGGPFEISLLKWDRRSYSYVACRLPAL